MGFNTKGKRKGRSGKKSRFNPSQSYVTEAVELYIEKGGKITTLIPGSDSGNVLNEPSLADEFLLGE